MDIKNKELKRRIIEISYKHKLSHLGSCLTAVDIIKEIYDQKKPEEKFILSSGHAGLALYVVLESQGGRDAEQIFLHHGVHPDRCAECGLDCSTGSLGQGFPIACGMALADRSKDVYCLVSDGEMAEGSIWEALMIRSKLRFNNLRLFINHNGFGAYGESESIGRMRAKTAEEWGMCLYRETRVDQLPFLKGQDAHYYVMTEDDYKQAMEILT